LRLFLYALLALAWLGGGIASAASPEEAYRAAHQHLNEEFDGFDAEREAPSPTVKTFWESVDALFSARGPDWQSAEAPDHRYLILQTQSLGEDLLAVSAVIDQFGHLAVLDHGKVRWSTTTDPAVPGCWRGAPERPCATIDNGLGLLPADESGAPRFYVVAGYAQDAGATRGFQLSLWRWKDGRAQPFHTTDFVMGGEEEHQGVSVAGNEIGITGKSHWLNFSVCGACYGRQQVHRLRVTPTGVTDLGIVSVRPELDSVDTLLGRLKTDQNTDSVATPEVAALVKKSWHGNLFAMDPVSTGDTACIAPDDNPPLTFHFAPGPTPRITAVEPRTCR
jgi:hypothetical protein